MNNEIKEILEELIWYRKIGKKDVYYPEYVLSNKKAFMLLDYITNLQQENKEWSMIFDTFSSRPYAHRYLEEKRKELGNKRIIGLDSEMIYKDYYDYKSRCEKAIEYINNFWKEKSYYESIENCLEFATMNEFEKEDLLNILQNGSES